MPGRNGRSDGVDAERVGRMGGRRQRERSVRSELAQRLRGFRGHTKVHRTGSSSGHGTRQRVVIKAHVSRHKPGKSRGSLARHVSYLGRESASLDGTRGVFYDAKREGVNARQEVAGWTEDRHHFRLIVSPERGGDIPDLTGYVREVIRRVERDLDTPLTWMAVNHHNTDNPHAHVLLRGKQADGTDLILPRYYISYGIRDRASEVATELLGERSAQDVQLAKSKEVEAERFTSLDRMIERHLDNGTIDVSPSRHLGFGADDRRLVLGRLQFLERLELARKGHGTKWHVETEFKQALRELGSRNDIIHQLYRHLGNEAGRVAPMVAGAAQPVAGVVIAKGSVDEIGEDRFVVLRDGAGQAHYGRVRDGEAYRDLAVGAVVELGAGAQRRRQVAEQIAAVARANDGVYSPSLHEAHLRAAEPGATDREILSAVRSGEWRLGFVAGFEGAGVRALNDGTYAVDADAFVQFSARGSQRTDVRVIAGHPVAEQIEAHAVTWLDRQMFGRRPDARTADHPVIQEALQQRQDWLVRSGYAARSARDPDRVELRPGALEQLAAEERADVTERLAAKYGRSVTGLPQGGTVSGKYRGIERLHAGKLAVVVAEDGVHVSPVRRTPEVRIGSAVTLERTSAREARLELATGPRLELGAGLFPDGTRGGR